VAAVNVVEDGGDFHGVNESPLSREHVK
jgi:hypothetical protein